MEEHPTAEHLAAFVEGKLERQRARLVVAHLLRGCPDCRQAANAALERGRSFSENAYDTAFERTSAAVRNGKEATAVPRRKRSSTLLQFPSVVPAR